MRPFKAFIGCAIMIVALVSSGCGYTTKTVLPRGIETIYVETVKNKIKIGELYSYQQGLEMDITNAVINRLQGEGILRVVKQSEADAVLKIDLVAYEQEGLRFDQLEEVEEYRLFIVLDMTLMDARTGEMIWNEPNFSGSTSYYVTPIKQLGEQAAALQAVDQLAKNVVDRIVEDW